MDKLLNIGIEINNNSYTPEFYAYKAFLEKKMHKVQLLNKDELSHNKSFDIKIYTMGFSHKWRNKEETKIIHEYQSLSTGYGNKIKNNIKKYLNIKPNGRIFLNSYVRKTLNFNDNIDYIERDMGIDESFFNITQNNIQKEYDIVYCGSINRYGLIKTLINLSKLGLKILVIGNVSLKIEKKLKKYNIICTGKIQRNNIPPLYKMATFGLNYTPNIYPFNVQTSTKTLEYCASGLKILSNHYNWISNFEKERNAKFLWLHDLFNIGNIDILKTKENSLITPNVKDLMWDIILKNSKLEEFLYKIYNEE